MVKSARTGSNDPQLERGDKASTSNKNGEIPTEPEQILESVNGTHETNEIKAKNANHTKQSAKTQKKNAETANVKSSKTTLVEKKQKNAQPLSKTKERPKRGVPKQMESTEDVPEVSQPDSDNSDLATQIKKSVKRKADSKMGQSDAENVAQSDTRSHKRKATDENKDVIEIAENITEESSSSQVKPEEKVVESSSKENDTPMETDEKKDQHEQMETEESNAAGQENSETVKRKADIVPDGETTSPRKKRATEKKAKDKSSEKLTEKTVASTRTRKAVAASVPSTSKPSKTAVQKKTSSLKVKANKEKDQLEQMETEESPAAEQENAETDGETTAASRKRRATEKKAKDKSSEKLTEKTVASTRTRTAVAASVPSTSKPSKTAVPKKSSSSLKVKAKKEKVFLTVPQLKVSGKVFVIGDNGVGQLGFGEEVEEKKRPAMLELPQTIADIAAGGMHSVCLTQNGEVITFGCNDEGALGRLTSNEKEEATPVRVDISEKIVQISAGDSHTAALAETGQVYLWGNFRNSLGPIGLTADGSKQVKPIKILTGIKVVKILSGAEHLVCLSEEGFIYTCGCGESGQLGRVSERVSVNGGRKGLSMLLEPDVVHIKRRSELLLADDIGTGSYSTFFKTKDTGDIYTFGLNNYAQLGYKSEKVSSFFPTKVASFSDKTWSQITGGQHHTLSLDNNGMVYSLGRDDYGRLGLGEGCGEKSVPTLITTLEEEKCVNISCGNCVSFALTSDGSVYSWGMGTSYQLGHGNDDDCQVPKRIEGNFASSWRVHKVSGGGQHTLLLAAPKASAKSQKES